MIQLTGQNLFARSFSGGYKLTNGSHACKFVVKSSESTKLAVDEHVDIDDGE